MADAILNLPTWLWLLLELPVLAGLAYGWYRLSLFSKRIRPLKTYYLGEARYSQQQIAQLRNALQQAEPMFDWSKHTRALKKAALMAIATTAVKVAKRPKESVLPKRV